VNKEKREIFMNPEAMGRILQTVDSLREETVDFLGELVRTESYNPPGDTGKIIEVVKRKARTFPVSVFCPSSDPKKLNILLSCGGKGDPHLLYNSHLDTVPPGDPSRWKDGPLSGKICQGKLFGRGAADAKGSGAAMVMAQKALVMAGVKIDGKLTVNLVADEETGGALGTRFIRDQNLVSLDFVVIGEITGNRIATAEKGTLIMEVTTHGRSAHASTPWEGINAISKMASFLTRLEADQLQKFAHRRHPLTPPPSINFGTITGGVKSNMVADICKATIDRRTLPNEKAETALKEIQEVIENLAKEDPEFNAKLEVLRTGSPIDTLLDSPLVRYAQHACSLLGLPAEPVGYAQASDGRFFAEKGIPTILLGPGEASQAHTVDESIDIAQVLEASRLYALLAFLILHPQDKQT
jgi:succinyl-diaminopimelate desuccinylase